MNKKEKIEVVGKTTRSLFDTEILNEAKRAYAAGDRKLGTNLLEKARKPMFQWNAIGKAIYKMFGLDLKLQSFTGFYTLSPVTDNLVTTKGKEIIAKQLNGVTTAPVTAIALGTGTTAAAAGDTALGTEITTNGGARGAATATNETTTTTGDTMKLSKSFSITGTLAITEEGLLDNNTSGGNLLARQVFSAVNVGNGDTFQVDHEVQFT